MSADVETNIVAVEKVKEYSNTEKEVKTDRVKLLMHQQGSGKSVWIENKAKRSDDPSFFG